MTDTFIYIYFFILGVSIMLKIISYFLKWTDIDDIKVPIEDLAEDVIHWCQIMYPVRKKSPRVLISNEKSKLAGEYCYFNNTIIIYRMNNVLHSFLIDTLIHEYFHYYLITSDNKNNLYQKQLELYGYENHPQEIICRAAADKLEKEYLNSRF